VQNALRFYGKNARITYIETANIWVGHGPPSPPCSTPMSDITVQNAVPYSAFYKYDINTQIMNSDVKCISLHQVNKYSLWCRWNETWEETAWDNKRCFVCERYDDSLRHRWPSNARNDVIDSVMPLTLKHITWSTCGSHAWWHDAFIQFVHLSIIDCCTVLWRSSLLAHQWPPVKLPPSRCPVPCVLRECVVKRDENRQIITTQ